MKDMVEKRSADIGPAPAGAMYRAYNTWFKDGSHGFFFRWNGEAWIRTTIAKSEVVNIDRARRSMLQRHQQVRVRKTQRLASVR